MPLTLDYLDRFHYGVWLILVSIVEWFGYFDIGIGQGLRNKMSEALAKDDVLLAKSLVSTAYAISSMIFLSLILVFAVVNPFLNWNTFLNVPPTLGQDLNEIVFYVFAFFCIRFVVNLIKPILYAEQEPAINNIIGPLGSTLSLLGILVLAHFVKSSLFWASIIFSSVPLLVMLGFTMVLFKTRYKSIAPSWQHVNFGHSKYLLGLGFNFFIIQISMLVLFSTANLVITQLFGPEEVTIYNIANKYFTIAILVNSIVTLTYWSPFTEAYVKQDFVWIKQSVRRLNMFSVLLIAGIVISFFLADPLIKLWLGKSIAISMPMKITMCLWAIIQVAVAPYIIFINGSSKVRLQLYVSIFSIVVTIPLSILFCKIIDIGSAGVIIAIICSALPSAVLWRIQYHKLVNGTAVGIWNK